MENIGVVKTITFSFAALLLLTPFFVFAYEPHTTHKGLTRDIVRFFEYAYPNRQLTDEEQTWIEGGAVDEDANIRAVFHFYDPVHDRGLKGNISSKEWAQDTKAQARLSTEYLATIGSAALPLFRSDTDFSWNRAVYEYAHGDKKRALESLGHVLHLLEDVTVPDHTRNDAHPPFFDSLFEQASPYEHWTGENFNAENISVTKSLTEQKQMPVALTSLNEYFDTLALYSNKNFFSKSTIFDSYYAEPSIGFERSEEINGEIYVYGYRDVVGKIYRLVGIEKERNPATGEISKSYFIRDDNNLILSDYWNLLSKQAVVHGAGVVKLFFDAVEEEKQTHALLEKNKSTFARVYDNTKGVIFAFAKNLYGSSVTTADLDELLVEQGAALALSNTVSVPTQDVVLAEDTAETSGEAGGGEVLGVSTEEGEARTVSPPQQDGGSATQRTQPTIPNFGNLFPVPIVGGGGDGVLVGGGGGVAALADTTPPDAPIITAPADFSQALTTTSITFSGSAEAGSMLATDFGSATTTADSAGNWVLALSGFPQGTTTAQFYAADTSGNVSAPTSAAFFIDSIGPDISLTVSSCADSIGASECLVATTTIALSWSSSASDTDHVVVDWGSGSVSGTTTSASFTAIDNSVVTITATAYDANGNAGAMDTKTARVATLPVVINEIAWSGTSHSSADEWIELYNPTDTDITLSQFTLFAEDLSPYLPLSGIIPARGYYLIERKNTGETDEATESPVADFPADLWESFSDGLNNRGEHLQLVRATGGATTTVDEILKCNNWCGKGSASPYYISMERYSARAPGADGTNWGTNGRTIINGKGQGTAIINGTPRQKNYLSYQLGGNAPMTTDLTLTKEDGPYLVDDYTFQVPAGTTLTLNPGAVIKFHNRARLAADGNIVARGTEGEPVVFTSITDDEFGGDLNRDGICDPGNASSTSRCPQAREWFGIELSPSSIGSSFDHAIFRHAGLYYDGGSQKRANLYVEGASPPITDSVFEKSGQYGLYLKNASSTVTGNTFRDNTYNGASCGLYAVSGAPLIRRNISDSNRGGICLSDMTKGEVSDNAITNNVSDAISITGRFRGRMFGNIGSGNGRNVIPLRGTIADVDEEAVLEANGLPYLTDSDATVSASSTLTVNSGVVWKFDRDVLRVLGTLIVNGPALFTSVADDTDGTDAYDDGPADPVSVGYQEIRLESGSLSDIKNAEFRYFKKALAYTDSSISLENVTFTNNTLGISASPAETILKAVNITFSDNAATSTILLP